MPHWPSWPWDATLGLFRTAAVTVQLLGLMTLTALKRTHSSSPRGGLMKTPKRSNEAVIVGLLRCFYFFFWNEDRQRPGSVSRNLQPTESVNHNACANTRESRPQSAPLSSKFCAELPDVLPAAFKLLEKKVDTAAHCAAVFMLHFANYLTLLYIARSFRVFVCYYKVLYGARGAPSLNSKRAARIQDNTRRLHYKPVW